MKAYSIDLRKKIVQSVRKGVSKSETARRFDVNRSTVQRYIKRLDEEGSLAPTKRPGSRPKLDESALLLLEQDLERVVPGPPIDRGGSFSMGSVELR